MALHEAARLPTVPSNVFRREGEYWMLAFAGRVCQLRDAKGLHHIAYLLERPGEPVAAGELLAAVEPGMALRPPGVSNGALAGSAMLDGPAESAHRRGLDELRAALAEAERFEHADRVQASWTEMEFIEGQLDAAGGLAGRDRRVVPATERARLTVTKRVKGVLRRIGRRHPALAEHLARCVRTGVVCAYLPEPDGGMRWSL